MHNLEKLGFFLIGAGTGALVASVALEAEEIAPIGEEEAYIPMDDEPEERDDVRESGDVGYYTVPDRGDDYENKVLEMKRRAEDRRREFESMREHSKNSNVKYSRMYDDGKDKIEDILRNVGHDNLETGHPEDDAPSEDEEAPDEDYVTERVEEGFEVYLGENPQDFVSLVYYEGDSTLCDDREQLIPSPEDVVGTVALSRLVEGGPGAEGGIVFVRNTRTGVDYEVVLDVGRYSETVLGIFEANLKKGDGGDVHNR